MRLCMREDPGEMGAEELAPRRGPEVYVLNVVRMDRAYVEAEFACWGCGLCMQGCEGRG